jgi:hypothetical protein
VAAGLLMSALPYTRHSSGSTERPLSADSVEKFFLGDGQNFLGPLMRLASGDVRDRFTQKRPRTIVSALRGFDAVETSKNQLSRNFWSRSIFDFCNSICRKLTSSRLPPAPNPIAGFPAQQTSTSAFEEAFWIFLTLLKY